ncbi:Aristolochene synthase [Fusarium beomiforme]|uniref:Aristolochene synthase n=1 Tax=Fusarium beomiforme TaxID=44412 RepID=A0A9P5DRE7_9HYPO|nr:Aristolochene synthase [Fusarium beomiforme]
MKASISLMVINEHRLRVRCINPEDFAIRGLGEDLLRFIHGSLTLQSSLFYSVLTATIATTPLQNAPTVIAVPGTPNRNFPNPKAERVLFNAGLSRATCLYFPLAKEDRVHFACRLLTDMSFDDGAAYNEKLIPIARDGVQPDRNVPAEFIRLLSSLMRFAMDLRRTPAELALMEPLERNCSKQISVVNDIYSWSKELRQSEKSHEEGSFLCSAVKVFSVSTSVDIDATVRILRHMIREREHIYDEIVSKVEAEGFSEAVKRYTKGLEYQMSGNELY